MSYSSTLGRWVQQDPAGYVDGLNAYEATLSSPVNFVDSLGLETSAAVVTPKPDKWWPVSGDIVGRPGVLLPNGLGGASTTEPTTRPATQPNYPPRVIVDGNEPAERRKFIQSQIDRCLGTKRGRALYDILVQEDRTVTLKLSTQDQNEAHGAGKADSVTVDAMHPGPRIMVKNRKTGKERVINASICRKLAHELGHAIAGTLDDGPDRLQNVETNENPIVEELGEDPRIRY